MLRDSAIHAGSACAEPRPCHAACDTACDMRFVLDTNVVVAAQRSTRGASAEVLRRVRRGRGTLLLSTPLLLEWEANCKAPEHQEAAGLSEEEVDVILNVLVARAERVEPSWRWRPQLRDPGDELVLEAAVNGRADALVTFNARDFAPAAPRFGLDVIGPRDLVGRMP